MNDFSGKWQTTFGPMELTQDGAHVRGAYVYMGIECTVEGEAAQGKLTFTYQEPAIRGEGWFELRRRGHAFVGQFRPEGDDAWQPWEGERVGFDGLWNSSFGLLRLSEDGGQVRGWYEVGTLSRVEGRVKGNRLSFRYHESNASGQGRFELAEDGLSFQGEWKSKGGSAWQPWSGLRVRPLPNRTWLVVVEAPWQRFLAEQEYAFGHMLREFFARLTNVEVRHRFFSNEAGLHKCCRDLMYIAEPVVLVLATHGRPEGIPVDGQIVNIASLLDSLQFAGDLRLVHFSACSLMHDPAAVAALQTFSDQARLAVSGYTTSVNWAASAIIEFAYLEMILAKQLPPAEAAAQLGKLLPFSGDVEVPGGAFPAAGFRIVVPKDPEKSTAPKSRRKVSR